MAAGMMTRECVGRKIIRAVALAAVGDAAAGRRTSALQRGPVGRQSGSRSWSPTIQNVQIRIIERERAREIGLVNDLSGRNCDTNLNPRGLILNKRQLAAQYQVTKIVVKAYFLSPRYPTRRGSQKRCELPEPNTNLEAP